MVLWTWCVFMEAWPSVCVHTCVFGYEGVFARKDKGFNGARMPVCVVVCRINGQQLWFILYSQCRGPLYLTGKVKAYSLEAVQQRSTCSLGMRNRTIERKTWKKCTLFGLHIVSDILKTHTVLFAAKALLYYPLVLSPYLSPRYLQYLMP